MSGVHPHLAPYVLDGRPTGVQLGSGSYGTVEEIEVDKLLICAAKKIHESLLSPENIGTQNLIEKYHQECQLMSRLRHPNITQFLGLCYLPNCQLPMLVMEKLEGNLHGFLETTPNIPTALKWSILEDVARGLHYLHTFHSQPVIHRDLTAKNVLLTSSLTAKITDLGNSRIVNPDQAQNLTQQPGTLVYMPPEALSTLPYDTSLDIFSFGHLTLFTLIQAFPKNLLPPTFQNPENPSALIPRSEVERREEYFKQLEGWNNEDIYVLIQLTKGCLSNEPSQRPPAKELLHVLANDTPRRELEKRIAVQQLQRCEIQRLQSQLDLAQVELKQKEGELQEIIADVQQAVDEECQKLYAEPTQQKDEQVRRICLEPNVEFQRELSLKDQEIQHLLAVVENERYKNTMLENDLQAQFLRIKEAEVQQIYLQFDQQMKERCEQMKKEHQMELEHVEWLYSHGIATNT